MMKELGKQWADMNEEEKQPYAKLAEKGNTILILIIQIYLMAFWIFKFWCLDKERYDQEFEEFERKGGNTKILKEIEEKRPKKALSAYMIFVRETRSKI